jgi:serine/threonine protein kinase/Tol biopolymer transport system component
VALTSGIKLGPYEIVAPLGAGGMGEVYRARDTRLERTVAIKILPASLSSDPDLRQRLEREAKTVSKLSHPNICTLHDIGHHDDVDFLVMEYVEGETLEQRLQRGPVPLEQTIRYAAQIADALAKAHKQAIIHRDLKPSNVMLTKAGAKLMDFGLAKQAETAPSAVALTEKTMEQSKLTGKGTIVGTFRYMAPEQLEGKEADAQTDIFALGEVIYEMVTGKSAFAGKSRASLIAAILSSDPTPIRNLQPTTPPTLERIVKKCLAKDPDDRWQSAADLASELRWVGEAGSQAGSAGSVVGKRKYRERVAWILAAVLLVLATVFGVGYFHRAPRPERAMHFSIALSPSMRDLTVSPDGRALAYIAPRPNGGGNVLWVHEIGSTGTHLLENTEGGSYPFWSPDGRSIGFFADAKLKRIEANGGPVQILCDAPFGRGGTWNRDEVLVFAPNAAGGLARVSAAGGAVTPVNDTPPGGDRSPNFSHRWPSFLPDGKHFLYSVADFANLQSEANAIYLGSLGSKEQRRLVTSNSNAVYVPSGYLVFFRSGTLMAQRFDADQLQLRGETFAVANEAEYLSTVARAIFSVSESGTLVYRTGSSGTFSQLQWFDRNGKRLATVGAPGSYANPRISPDGKKVALDIDDPQSLSTDVWVVDLGDGVPSRFTFDPAQDETPIWSPDGSRILWMSQRGGGTNFYLKTATGSGSEYAISRSAGNLPSFAVPNDWSRDGRFLLYTDSRPDGILQMWILPMTGQSKPHPFVHGQSAEMEGQFSPDGHWVAYSSNESGRWQVYVAPFPGPGGKYQISTDGGQQPRWRRDGKELFFLSRDKKLMAVPVKVGTTLEFGAPTVLFQTRAREPLSAEEIFSYDVSANGQRFLVDVNSEESNPATVNIVLNWTSELQK